MNTDALLNIRVHLYRLKNSKPIGHHYQGFINDKNEMKLLIIDVRVSSERKMSASVTEMRNKKNNVIEIKGNRCIAG